MRMTSSIDLAALHATFKRGEYAVVLDALLPAFETFGTNEAALALIANAALLGDRPFTAIPALERLIALRPDQAQYQRILSQARNRAGAAARREKRLGDAEMFFCQALDTWPDNVDALFNLALLYDDTRAHDQALPLWRRLRDLKPDDTEIALDYANSLALNRQTAEAQAILEHLADRFESRPALMLRHAEALANADRPRAAAARLKDIQPEPAHATRLYALGDRLAQASDINAAETVYRLATEPLGYGTHRQVCARLSPLISPYLPFIAMPPTLWFTANAICATSTH